MSTHRGEGSNSRPTIHHQRRLVEGDAQSISSLQSLSTLNTVLPTYTPSSPSNRVSMATEATSVPPRYSYSGHPESTQRQASRSDYQTFTYEHTFSISGNKPWATLRVFSRDPREQLPKGPVPRLWGGSDVAGVVDLNLDSVFTLNEIALTLRGKIIAGSTEGSEVIFLNHTILLYHKSQGNPLVSEGTSAKKLDGRLPPGSYKFPFSFPFPLQVDLESSSGVISEVPVTPFLLSPTTSNPSAKQQTMNQGQQTSSSTGPSSSGSSSSAAAAIVEKRRRSTLSSKGINKATIAELGLSSTTTPNPCSFKEPKGDATVNYEIIIHFGHGRFRPDSKISTLISYNPALVALPPFTRRQQAYEAATMIPSPLSDPEGWIPLSPVIVRGSFRQRPVSITCTLYLAQPLSYARGTHIPLYLRLECQDQDALSALTNPSMIAVRLTRSIRHLVLPGTMGRDKGEANSAFMGSGAGSWHAVNMPPVPGTKGKGSDFQVYVNSLAKAVFWTAKVPEHGPGGTNSSVNWFEGEIHLPKDMKASSDCLVFSIQYFVELLPLDAPAFEIHGKGRQHSARHGSDPRKQILLSHPVDIATFHPEGITLPIAFTEPAHHITEASLSGNKDDSDDS